MKKILVLCTGNSCRSQIAEGWLRHFANGKFEVFSAGIETHGVNPNAIFYMKEAGIDISKHTSNHINEYMNIQFDFIITVCDHAKEHCPYIPSKAIRIHYNFSDPSKIKGNEEEMAIAFRKTIVEIKEFSEKFVKEHFNNEI
ncbi:MAG: arsenate reductase ArsC [Leptospiraceae bacterium]|nr:arsenate reductase ArsC [Leptospiraceae bacterium]MCP5493718.1 arsenate reductase ArsC [Leptospiraceae bacterium]